jgi:hypothetical protein
MPLRRHAQALARRLLGPAHPAALKRWRRLQAAGRARRVARLTRAFVAWHGLTVTGGPFAGLTYPDATASSLVPKLLGTYERELHAAVEDLIRSGPAHIVNVGAADGYYAVGLARRCPGATVQAFEADAGERDLLARVARANGAAVEIGGLASAADLQALPDGTLVVMDCEGCERALLQPAALRTATILVELHDFLEPGVSDVIVERFRATHHVTLTGTAPQPPERGSDLGLAISEYRPGPMRWAVLRPT